MTRTGLLLTICIGAFASRSVANEPLARAIGEWREGCEEELVRLEPPTEAARISSAEKVLGEGKAEAILATNSAGEPFLWTKFVGRRSDDFFVTWSVSILIRDDTNFYWVATPQQSTHLGGDRYSHCGTTVYCFGQFSMPEKARKFVSTSSEKLQLEIQGVVHQSGPLAPVDSPPTAGLSR